MNLFFETHNHITAKYDESIEFNTEQTRILSVAKKGLKLEEFTQFELPLLYPEGCSIDVMFVRIFFFSNTKLQ